MAGPMREISRDRNIARVAHDMKAPDAVQTTLDLLQVRIGVRKKINLFPLNERPQIEIKLSLVMALNVIELQFLAHIARDVVNPVRGRLVVAKVC